LGGDLNVFQDRELGENTGNLERADDPPPENVGSGKMGYIFPFEENMPGIRGKHPGNQVEERGFARAVGPDDGLQFLLIEGKGQVMNRGQPAEVFGQIFQLEDGRIVLGHTGKTLIPS